MGFLLTIAAAGLLLAWLSGWWGARVLTFLLFVVVFGLVGYLTGAGFQYTGRPEMKDTFPILGVLGMLCGIGVAWPISKLPETYWRRRARILAQADLTGRR